MAIGFLEHVSQNHGKIILAIKISECVFHKKQYLAEVKHKSSHSDKQCYYKSIRRTKNPLLLSALKLLALERNICSAVC